MSAAHLVLLGFAALITVGTVLLALPISTRDHSVSPLTALFTATSAVCVTGLTLVDTGTHFSPFGHLVILVLIQLGGLGYMTGITLVALLAGQEISLRGRVLLAEAFELSSLKDRVRLVQATVLMTLAIEAVGAVLLTMRFAQHPHLSPPEALLFGVFHAVSAFCNAGFDLLGYTHIPGASMVPFVDDPWVNGVVALLVISGGLGFVTLWELFTRRRRRLSLHTRICVMGTLLLLAVGFLGVLALEWNNPNTLGGLPLPTRALAACFQSVTARTAGFQTVPIGDMRSITLLLLTILMFVGACPGGTGGGVKVTTMTVLLGSVWSTLRGRPEPELYHRRLAPDQIPRTLAIVTLAMGAALIGLGILTFTEPPTLQQARVTSNIFMSLVFETISALGTVGLSTGITSHLTPAGQMVLILLMLIGRIGPLTAAVALTTRPHPVRPRLPEERVLLG